MSKQLSSINAIDVITGKLVRFAPEDSTVGERLERMQIPDSDIPTPDKILDPYRNMANEPLPEKPHHKVRYLYGPLDGKEQNYYAEYPPEISAHPLIWQKTKAGLHADLTNEYAVYMQDPDDSRLMVFYGIEYREIDITKGADCIINRHWVTQR